MTEVLRLRPVLDADLADVEVRFADPEQVGVFNFAGYTDRALWRRRFEENQLLSDEKSVLMIELGDTPIGFVSWSRVMTGQVSYVLEFGISLWPEFRGKGLGTRTQKLLARYLFAHTQVNRIQAKTESVNHAEQRSLEKAGFVRESVLKGYFYRDGAWRDEVMYRMLREELPVDHESDGKATEDRG
jgi:RimJ/RimL family protein N-acetyltransferase